MTNTSFRLNMSYIVASYVYDLQVKKTPLSDENTIYFDENIDISIC